MKNKKLYIIGGIVLLVLIVIAFIFIKKEKQSKQMEGIVSGNSTPGTASTASTGSAISTKAEAFPLEFGMKGNEILTLQRELNKIAKSKSKPLITEDGVYGNQTYTAIIALVGASYVPVTRNNFLRIMAFNSLD